MNHLNYNANMPPLSIHWVIAKDSDKSKKIRKMRFLDEKNHKHHLVVVKEFVNKLSDVPSNSTSKKDIWIQVQDDDQKIGWAKIERKSVEDFLPTKGDKKNLKMTKKGEKKQELQIDAGHKTSSGESTRSVGLFALSLLASSGLANANSELPFGQNITHPNVSATNPFFPEYLENATSVDPGFSKLEELNAELQELNMVCKMHLYSDEVPPPSTQLSNLLITFKRLNDAIESGDGNLVIDLVKTGIDLNQKREDGLTFLSIAIQNGNKNMIMLLHKLGASLTHNKGEEPYLHIAVRSGQLASVEALLELGVPIDEKNEAGSTALHTAVKCKDMHMITCLISGKADVHAIDNNGFTALHYAVFAEAHTLKTLGEKEAFNASLKGFEVPSFPNPTVQASFDIIDNLVKAKANIDVQNIKGETPLHLAVSIGSAEVVKKLIDIGANVNALTKQHNTPLFYASKSFNRDIIDILIKSGANTKIYNHEGVTPVIVCLAAHPHEECITAIGMDAFSKQTLALKELTHSFEIGGFRTIWETVELEGWFSEIFAATFQVQIGSFSDQYSGSFSPAESLKLKQILKESIAMRTPRLISDEADRNLEIDTRSVAMASKIFIDKTPVLIHTGFQGHAIEILFQGNYMIICNKGAASQKPFQMLDMAKQDLATIETLVKQSLKISIGSRNEYMTWLKEISAKFKPEANDLLPTLLEQNYPFELAQLVGNCAWESLETALYASLLLDRISPNFKGVKDTQIEGLLAKTNKDFGTFMAFISVNTLKNYIDSFAVEGIKTPPSEVDKELEATTDSDQDTAKADQIVLFKAFKKISVVKTWDVDLAKQIGKIADNHIASFPPALKAAYITAAIFKVDEVVDAKIKEVKEQFNLFKFLFEILVLLLKKE